MKTRFTMFLMAMLMAFSANSFAQGEVEAKVPVAIFDFSEGPLNWEVRNFKQIIAEAGYTFESQWIYNPNARDGISAGMWLSLINQLNPTNLRNTMIYSPEIDLANAEEIELYIDFLDRWGQEGNNEAYVYVQSTDNLDLTLEDDSLFIKQWESGYKLWLETRYNNVELGLSTNWNNSNLRYAGPMNLAMFSGQKIRIAVHVWNNERVTAAFRNWVVKRVALAGTTDDTVAPVGQVTKVDSIGNTFMRGWYDADELCRVYWAVMPKGEQPASVNAFKEDLGTDAFIRSGSFNFNVPGIEKPLFITGLQQDTEYTLSYMAEDYKGNISAIQSVDAMTTYDLVAPVISKIEVSDVTEITASAHLTADESGYITYRLYSAGLEPQDFNQFMAGTGAVRSGRIFYDTLTEDFSWPLEGLTLNSNYILYAVVTDMTGNISAIAKSDIFTTLADETAPLITSLTTLSVSNHAGVLNLVSNEPIAGFGGARAYWSATNSGITLSNQEVLDRVQSKASGVAVLDSATYDNAIQLDNLNKNTSYTIHAVVVDGSGNMSEVATVNITTTNELIPTPVFIQEFDVLNQNYHFVEVVQLPGQEGNDHWSSAPNAVFAGDVGRVGVANQGIHADIWQEAWAMVGPIDLSGLSDIMVSSAFVNNFGNFTDRVTAHISNTYKGDGVVDMNDWTRISLPGDFTNVNRVYTTADWPVDNALGMDTEGVYIGFRYRHNRWNHQYHIYNAYVYGTATGEPVPPVIDWVETDGRTSTTANVVFSSNTYGRLFYYLLKDDGSGVVEPDYDKAISGEGADEFGYFDYTAGNFIDQSFSLGGLEPGTKYHMFTTFRNLSYSWAGEVYYDALETVFETPELNLTLWETVDTYATSSTFKTAAETSGRVYYTIRESGADAPADFQAILNSFDRRGFIAYNITDGSELTWELTGLVPGTAYDVYLTFTDPNAAYGSDVKKIEITTPHLQVLSAVAGDAFPVSEISDDFQVDFTLTTSGKGRLYAMVTSVDAIEPTAEEIIAGDSGIDFNSIGIIDPSEVIVSVDKLTEAEAASYEAWFVLVSGSYQSKVFALNRVLEYTYAITFQVSDENGIPLQGLVTKIGDVESITDTDGHATIDGLSLGNYDYTIVRGNYTEHGSVELTADMNLAVTVVEKYNLTLKAESQNGNPLSNVSITVGETTLTTAADNGEVVFENLVKGSYSYVATYGDVEQTGDVELDDHASVTLVFNTTSLVGYDASLISVYPNPASDFVNVSLSEEANLRIVDVVGRTYFLQSMQAGTHKIDLGQFKKGVYLIDVKTSNGKVFVSKLVVE